MTGDEPNKEDTLCLNELCDGAVILSECLLVSSILLRKEKIVEWCLWVIMYVRKKRGKPHDSSFLFLTEIFCILSTMGTAPT